MKKRYCVPGVRSVAVDVFRRILIDSVEEGIEVVVGGSLVCRLVSRAKELRQAAIHVQRVQVTRLSRVEPFPLFKHVE